MDISNLFLALYILSLVHSSECIITIFGFIDPLIKKV